MVECGKCGLTYGSASNDKCPNCGGTRQIIKKDLHKDCPYCGALNSASAFSCSSCGKGI